MRLVKALPFVALFFSSVAVADAPDNLLKADRFRGSIPGITIRDVPSAGREWVISSGVAKLEADGSFKVEVQGLVFPPGTPSGGTTGAVTHFAATLSCLDGTGATVNFTTPRFAATTTGDGEVKTRFENLPARCYAPVVLIRNASSGVAGAWFAATGF